MPTSVRRRWIPVCALLPLFWLMANSAKALRSLITAFGPSGFEQGLPYPVAGTGRATFPATLAGYRMAKYVFPGKRPA